MYFDFANVLVFLLLGLGLSGMMLGLGRLLRPSNPLAPKLATYECGEPPTGNAWINFNIRFYLVALIFVIFDVEIAFMYPVVAVFRDWLLSGRGATALAEMLLFIGILSLMNTMPEFTVTTKIDEMLNWTRKSSLWYMLFGLACCAIEMMQTGGPRSDLDRFGAVPRATPRQSDLMIIAGTLTLKMALRTKVLYDQMPDPKYVISMGSCSNCGGLFQLAYSVCDGVDKVIPVDVYVPGCPPRPESLTEGLLKLQEKMMQEKWLVRRGGEESIAARA